MENKMQVIDPDTLEIFDDDHPTGSLRQRYLFEGTDGTPENFMFSIAETTGRFQMVSHRHNFDQFRMALVGDMTMGPDRTLKEGHLGYFPEGSSYGPQDDEAGPVALVLQFGGASGYGYMSMGQYRAGREALRKKGHFEGAVFVRDDGQPGQKKKFSINAIWEEALGERLLIPTPRYDKPVFMNPKAYRWIPGQAPGVSRKALGTFSERETLAEMWRIEAGATLSLAAGRAIRLLFVLDGTGSAGGSKLGRYFGIRIDPGEEAAITADNGLELLSFRLPLIDRNWGEPDAPSFEPTPGEAVPSAFRDD
jgi:hypothetical protein